MFPDSVAMVQALESPRIIKTHLSRDMLPNGIIGGSKAKVKKVLLNRHAHSNAVLCCSLCT